MRSTHAIEILVACLIGACGSAIPNPRPVGPSLQQERSLFFLRTEQSTGPGRLLWGSVTPEVFARLGGPDASDADLVSWLGSLRLTDVEYLGPDPTEVQLDPGPGAGLDAHYFFLFQPRGEDLWPALFGHPGPNQWAGWTDGAGEVTLARGQSAPPTEERCTGERRQLVLLNSPEVQGAIGNETQRRLCVMLPPNYEADPNRRYPVVFLLPGMGGSDTTYAHLADENTPVILVGIDGRTRFGATYFFDSDYAGHWERFIERVVAHVDAEFRTLSQPRSRGVLGHSTGGYNAISLVLRRTDLFEAAAASSPDGLDFEYWMSDANRIRPFFLGWTRFEDGLDTPGQMVSYAVQFANRSEPGAIHWPFDLQTGQVDRETWQEWLAVQPLQLLNVPEITERVQTLLGGRIFISSGRQDAFSLFEPAERFHQRLDELSVSHVWRPTNEGHFDGSAERRVAGLRHLVGLFESGPE